MCRRAALALGDKARTALLTICVALTTSALKLLQGFGFSLQYALGFLLSEVFIVKVSYLLAGLLISVGLLLYCHFNVSSLEDGIPRTSQGGCLGNRKAKASVIPVVQAAAIPPQ